MDISEQELRAMVREAIATRGGQHAAPPTALEAVRGHGSHGLLTLVAGGDQDGRCLIEPAVPCNHCGYCQSLGH